MAAGPILTALASAVLAVAALSGGLASCGRRSTPSDGRPELQPPEQQPPEQANERLEREVRAKLYGDPQLSGGGSIVVIVDGGNVVLQGWVASATERTLAEADAATVAGISNVDDRLLVRKSPPAPPAPSR